MTTDKIAWVDTETTGLTPEDDYTLEVAVIITDFELNELGFYNAAIGWPDVPVSHLKTHCNDYVREMHGKTGLWERVDLAERMEQDCEYVDMALTDFLERNNAVNCVVGGNSITHDRNFLKMDLPETYRHLHYRSIDVTSIALVAKEWFGVEFQKERKHSALDDIRESIAELKYLRKHAFKSQEELETENLRELIGV